MEKEKAAPVGSRAAAWYQRLLNTNFEESDLALTVTYNTDAKENPATTTDDYTQKSDVEGLIAEYGQRIQEAVCRRLDSLGYPEPEKPQNR